MRRLRLTLIGGIAAVLLCAGAAFAANPGTANRTSPGSTSFGASTAFAFVNANLTATQIGFVARTTVSVTSRSTNNYGGSAQVRCNGNATIFTDIFGGADTSGTKTCSNIGNAWAGTLSIF